MHKRKGIVLVWLIFLLCLAGCCVKYDKAALLGKISMDIETEFGLFDYISMPADADGMYRCCQCGYTIKEMKKGFLGTTPELLLLITFDENAAAVSCKKGYRPGG